MFKLNATTFTQTVKDNPKDEVRIVVGDDKQPDFKPQWKLERWGNEVNFSLRAKEEAGAKLKELPDGTIIYEAKDYEVHIYDKGISEEHTEGAGEFEWVLKTKPVSNVLEATIQTKGLNFFYQPPLTPEEIAEGGSRSDNVIGSYAVYHKTKGGMNDIAGMEYKAGKAFHIFRPKAIDANGIEQWCDLNIDEAKGLLTVTVHQKFLDEVVYPVRVDPTFGYTTAGASSSVFDRNIKNVIRTASENGTIDSISFYNKVVYTGQSPVGKTAMYLSSDSSLISPQGAEVVITTSNNWNVSTFTGGPSITSGTAYRINAWGFTTQTPVNPGIWLGYDSISETNSFNNLGTYGAWPNPGGFTNTTATYSIYATYTASGGTAVKDIIQSGIVAFAR